MPEIELRFLIEGDTLRSNQGFKLLEQRIRDCVHLINERKVENGEFERWILKYKGWSRAAYVWVRLETEPFSAFVEAPFQIFLDSSKNTLKDVYAKRDSDDNFRYWVEEHHTPEELQAAEEIAKQAEVFLRRFVERGQLGGERIEAK